MSAWRTMGDGAWLLALVAAACVVAVFSPVLLVLWLLGKLYRGLHMEALL